MLVYLFKRLGTVVPTLVLVSMLIFGLQQLLPGDPAERKKVFEQIAAKVLKERPVIYLYHRNWLWAYNAKLAGVRGLPDGLLRVTGLKMAP